ncbi:MAG: hypothetical protein V3U03_01730 [Myxococcota bacterium]
MAKPKTAPCPVVRIRVRIQVGDSLMAASDDPLFLGLRGSSGREFRLHPARGRSLRRGADDHYVLGAPDDSETNVAHPELNDPTAPPLDAASVEGVFLRKGTEPIPNVRALGEMDDRLEIAEAEVEIHSEGQPKALRFARSGPIWLGLVCGQSVEIPRVKDG